MKDSPKKSDSDQEFTLSEEQQKHRDELYNYKKDAEGTLDTSAVLDRATNGQPTTPTTGPDPDSSNKTDELLDPGFNNPIDDNNR